MTPHRTVRSLVLAALIATGAFGVVPRALAAPPTLADAEQAYVEIDFERAHELSSEALRSGGHPPGETIRLYTLLGISGAALGREDVARRSFVRVLLGDPAQKLDQDLSPKLRAPYLEARGTWAAATGERGLDAKLHLEGNVSTIELFDPMNVVHTIEFSTKQPGADSREPERLARNSELRVATTGMTEYRIRLLDEYDNALWERRGEPARPVAAPSGAASQHGPTDAPSPTPYYMAAATLGVLGLGALGGGVAFQLERERLADEWNSSACEVPGTTRSEQCAGVDEQRQQAEALSIGLYAAGGALVTASVVTLVIAPSAPERASAARTVSCNPSLGVIGLACHGRF